MSRHRPPDPYQEDYERQKAAGFPPPRPAMPRQGPTAASQAAAAPAAMVSPQAAARPATVSPGKLIIGGVILVLVIIAAVVGHAIASSDSIAVGDCVVTNPNVLTGWDIKKVACGSNPGASLMVQKVVSVQDGSNGACDYGLTTFQDDPANKTYCLNDFGFGG